MIRKLREFVVVAKINDEERIHGSNNSLTTRRQLRPSRILFFFLFFPDFLCKMYKSLSTYFMCVANREVWTKRWFPCIDSDTDACASANPLLCYFISFSSSSIWRTARIDVMYTYISDLDYSAKKQKKNGEQRAIGKTRTHHVLYG